MVTERTSPIGAFFIGALRIAFAIFFLILLLAGAGIALFFGYDHWNSFHNAPLAKVKIWPTITNPALAGASFHLTTKWKDNALYYQFTLDAYPREKMVTEPPERNPFKSPDGRFTIRLPDASGFKLYEHDLNIRDMSRIVGDDGKPTALSMNDTMYVAADIYREVSMWEVHWRLP